MKIRQKIVEAAKPKVMDLAAKGIVKLGFFLGGKALGAAGNKLKAVVSEKAKNAFFEKIGS